MITSDSSRFWAVEDYFEGRAQKSLDKQYLIDWLKGTGWKDGLIIPLIPERVACYKSQYQNYQKREYNFYQFRE